MILSSSRWLIGFALLLSAVQVAHGQVSEGNTPFVPTRLEWLEMYLNAGKSIPYSKDSGFGISYITDAHTDTLYMVVLVNQETVNPKALEGALHSSRRLVTAYVKRKGWSDWLKIEERLENVGRSVPPEQPKPDPPTPSKEGEQ
jgi:hypothetical protein